MPIINDNLSASEYFILQIFVSGPRPPPDILEVRAPAFRCRVTPLPITANARMDVYFLLLTGRAGGCRYSGRFV